MPKKTKRSKRLPTQTSWKKSDRIFHRRLYSCSLIVAPTDQAKPQGEARWGTSCGRPTSKTFWTDRGVSFTANGAKNAAEQSVKLHKGKKR